MRARTGYGLYLFLWFLAFSHRLFLLLGSVDRCWPFSIFYEGDAESFYNYAQAILSGTTYDAGIPFHPPLFPCFLAVWHGLLGDPVSHLGLRILLCAVFSLQVPLAFALLRRFLSRGEALAGALLCTYSFGLSVISISPLSEGLYLVLLLCALLLFQNGRAWRAADAPARPAILGGSVLGLLLGALALTRAEGLVLGGTLLLWGAAERLRTRWNFRGRGWTVWGAAAIGFVLVLTPWTVRNAVTIGRVNRDLAGRGLAPLPTFVPTTAYGPLNFALANNEKAPGYFTRDLLTSGVHQAVLQLNDPQHHEYFVHGVRYGLAFVRDHPAAFLSLAGRKLALLGRALRLGWTEWDLPGGLKGTRYPVDLFTPDAPAAVAVHLLLLIPGMWLLIRRRADEPIRGGGRAFLGLTAVLLLLSLASTVAFFGYARQGVLLFPFLFGLEGVTLAHLCRAVGKRLPDRWRRPMLPAGGGLAVGVLLVVCLLWLVELGGAFQNRDYVASGETVAGSKMLNRDSIMRIELVHGQPVRRGGADGVR